MEAVAEDGRCCMRAHCVITEHLAGRRKNPVWSTDATYLLPGSTAGVPEGQSMALICAASQPTACPRSACPRGACPRGACSCTPERRTRRRAVCVCVWGVGVAYGKCTPGVSAEREGTPGGRVLLAFATDRQK
jgi:hypothetical protein